MHSAWPCVASQVVDVGRAFTDALNAGDVDAAIAICDPGIEFHSTFAAVGGAVYHGHEGMRRWLRDMEDSWEQIESTPEAFFDLGDRLLVFTVVRGRGRRSGVEAELATAHLARVREGLVVDYRAYTDRQEALSDLGLSEDEPAPILP
jgi:ketosteroid isomerase-like protein